MRRGIARSRGRPDISVIAIEPRVFTFCSNIFFYATLPGRAPDGTNDNALKQLASSPFRICGDGFPARLRSKRFGYHWQAESDSRHNQDGFFLVGLSVASFSAALAYGDEGTMATIRKLRGRWQAAVRRKGMQPRSKSFDSKSDAERWARSLEAELDRNGALLICAQPRA